MEYRYLDIDGLNELVYKIDEKYSTKSELSTETSERTSADSALDIRVSALESGGEVGDSILVYDDISKFPAKGKGSEKKLYVARYKVEGALKTPVYDIYQYKPSIQEYHKVGRDLVITEAKRASEAEDKLSKRIDSSNSLIREIYYKDASSGKEEGVLITKVNEEKYRAQAEESNLDSRVSITEQEIEKIVGDEKTEGSIKKALKDAKDFTTSELDKLDLEVVGSEGAYIFTVSQSNGQITVEKKEAISTVEGITPDETNLVQAKAINAYVEGVKTELNTSITGVSDRVTKTESDITTINGDETVDGSIKKAVKGEETRATGVEKDLTDRVVVLEGKTKLSNFEDDLSYNEEKPEESTLKHNHDHVYFKKENIITEEPPKQDPPQPWGFTDKDKVISAELSSEIEKRVFNLENGGAGEVRGVYLDDKSILVDHEAQIRSSDIKTLNKIYQVTLLPESGEKYADYVLMTGELPYSVYRWEKYQKEEQTEPQWQWKEVCKSTLEGMPLVGDANKLYKTSDNRVFHCYFTKEIIEEQEVEVINWLEVGLNNLIVCELELPPVGEVGKVYYLIKDGKLYRWVDDPAGWQEISGGSSGEIAQEIAQLKIRLTTVESNLEDHVNINNETKAEGEDPIRAHGLTGPNLSVLRNLAEDGKSSDYKVYHETLNDAIYFTQKGAYDLYTELNNDKLTKSEAVLDVNYSSDELKLSKKVWNKTTSKKESVDLFTLETLKKDLLLDKVNNTADVDKLASNDVITRLATKINYTDIANDLTTGDTKKVLAAPQGIALKSLIEESISKWTGLASALTFKGTVYGKEPVEGDPVGATYLPTSGQKVGDFYQTLKDSKSWGWNGTEWLELSAVITIKDYIATASEVSEIISKYGQY